MKRKFISFVAIIAMLAFLASSCSIFGNKEEEAVGENDPSVIVSQESNEVNDLEADPGLIDADPNQPDLTERESNGISFDLEREDAEIKRVKTNPEKFVGRWTATSDQALYLYGNIDLIINSNGSWAADITEEKLGGSWKEADDHIHLDDTSELNFDFDLAFDQSGDLVMTETNPEGVINTVLTKVN